MKAGHSHRASAEAIRMIISLGGASKIGARGSEAELLAERAMEGVRTLQTLADKPHIAEALRTMLAAETRGAH